MSKRNKLIVAVAAVMVAVLGTGVIILRGSPGNYWVTPGELMAEANNSEVRSRVGGKIVAGSLETGNGLVVFDIKAGGERTKMPVSYAGYVTAAFSDLSEVIVEGSWRDGTLYADKILVRCPDNYMAEKATISVYTGLGIEGALYR